MMNLFSLKDKIAVVTGGYGHLGYGISMALMSAGAKVIIAGRSHHKFLEKFGVEHSNLLEFRLLDLSDSNSIKKLFGEIEKDYGQLDIVFNNGHYLSGRNIDDMNDEDWTHTMEGILGSVHKCIREVIPIMRKQGSGKIINIASMYGMVSPNFDLYSGDGCEKYTNPPHYGAAKAGVIQLTKYYASLLGKDNIYVNAITPGPFPKPQIQNDNPSFIARLRDRNPLNRIGVPKDLGGICILLSSGASDFITGQNFIIDGGWTIW